MGNLKRYFEENRAYFVTTVTKERKSVFTDKHLCRILLVTIEYYKTIFNYEVYGYCLMPDHLHLLVAPNSEFNLSIIMKMIKGSFSRKVNKLKDQTGPLWQRRYYDEVVRNERQLFHLLEYMHQNPVKAGLVSSVSDYLYSSYSQYCQLPNPVGEILQINPLN